MRRLAGGTLVAALALFLAVTSAPRADTRRFDDGTKARGPLDIVRISHAHRKGGKLVHTIRLRRAWPVKKLRHQGFVHVTFELRGHDGNPPERTLWIVYEKGRLGAHMYSTLGDPPKHLSRVRLERPDWRTVRAVFPKELLRKRPLARYRWNVISFVEGRHELCPRGHGCRDAVPNPSDGRVYVRHVL
jgi:hypothetical protein